MRVTLLVDNLARNGLRSEHGLSFLVETEEGFVLFDTGQSDAWLHNLKALGHKPAAITAVAISHGHYDHTGGLPDVARESPGARFFAHRECFTPKFARLNGIKRYVGVPGDATPLRGRFELNRTSTDVAPGVTLSGEVPLEVPVALYTRFLTGDEEMRQDTFEDEQCVILQNGDRTAVLVGCAHRGIENNILAAMAVAGVSRIDMVAGGFHLGDAEEDRLESLSGFLSGIDIGQIACCHCTGMDAYFYLSSMFGSRVTVGRAGMTWEI